MAQATKKAASKTASTEAATAEPAGETCQVAKCKQTVRAKGYCRKHFMAWRRGKTGDKHRYKICSKPECRKPATTAGRCEEHVKGRKAAPGAEAAPAA